MPSPFRLSAAPAPVLVIDSAAPPLLPVTVVMPSMVFDSDLMRTVESGPPLPIAVIEPSPTPIKFIDFTVVLPIIFPVPAGPWRLRLPLRSVLPVIVAPPVPVIFPLALIVVAPAIEPALMMPSKPRSSAGPPAVLLLMTTAAPGPLELITAPPAPKIDPEFALRPLPEICPLALITVAPVIAPALRMSELLLFRPPLLLRRPLKVWPPEPVIVPVPAERPTPVTRPPVEVIAPLAPTVVAPEIAPAFVMPSPFRLSAAPAPLLVIDTAAPALLADRFAPPVPVINPLAPIVVAPAIGPVSPMPESFSSSPKTPGELLTIIADFVAVPFTIKPLVTVPSVTVLLAPAPVWKAPPAGFVIVTVDCANAGPTAKGATRAVEAMSCVRSARRIRARVPVATVPVDVMRFTVLEIFILVPRCICTS